LLRHSRVGIERFHAPLSVQCRLEALTRGRTDHFINIFLLCPCISTYDLDLQTWPR